MAKNPSYGSARRIGAAKVREFGALVEGFKLGYRNREDKTVLPPGVLIQGSQNVLTNVAQHIAVRKGYTLDGQSNAAIAPILASYDWDMHIGQERHLRAGFNTTGSNGKLQYRYVDSLGAITWRDLMTSLTSVAFNFTTFWDFNTEKKDFLLFVDGSSNIYEWSGGLATYASSTVNTITIQGVPFIAELNFYNLAPFGSITINGVDYSYTGVAGTTFTGIAPDPTGAGIAVGAIIHQKVKTTANSAMTAIPATFANALIGNLRNQIYIGSLTDRSVYVSKVNNYKDYAFTAPVRVVGEGALVTLDGVPTGLIAQEDKMTLSAGKDQWYETKFTLSSDLAKEDFAVTRLKTTSKQAAQSQAAITKINNDIAFISFEPAFNTLGRIANVVLTQQTSNISDSIKNDFDAYNFTNCSVAYYRQFIYLAIPANNTVRIYNIQNNYWEAPQILPISRFAIINGELYGHSYQVGETYKLFTGYNDNGGDINAVAKFSFQNYGVRTASKSFNNFYVEGYISSNTTLNLNFQYDIDGCATYTSFPIVGTDSQIVCLSNNNGSLGKVSLGKNPLGSSLAQSNPNGLPPKFRVIKTFPAVPFYEQSTSFSSIGVDQQWEILAFGGAEMPTSEGSNSITQ